MKRLTLLLTILLVLLAACAQATPSAPTQPPAPTATPRPTDTPAPTPSPTSSPTPTGPMVLTSSAFANEGDIPLRYGQREFRVAVMVGGEERTFACFNPPESENISPDLAWTNVPAGAQSLALIMVDDLHFAWSDIPAGTFFIHWLVYNIPPAVAGLPEGIPGDSLTLADGSMQGRNDYPEPYDLGYGGPCPPPERHLYIFTLYALDTVLDLSPGVDYYTLMGAMEGHILAQAELKGYFSGE